MSQFLGYFCLLKGRAEVRINLNVFRYLEVNENLNDSFAPFEIKSILTDYRKQRLEIRRTFIFNSLLLLLKGMVANRLVILWLSGRQGNLRWSVRKVDHFVLSSIASLFSENILCPFLPFESLSI